MAAVRVAKWLVVLLLWTALSGNVQAYPARWVAKNPDCEKQFLVCVCRGTQVARRYVAARQRFASGAYSSQWDLLRTLTTCNAPAQVIHILHWA
jgi:hypothetical protein